MTCQYNDLDQRRILNRLEAIETRIIDLREGRVDAERIEAGLAMVDDMLYRSRQGEDIRSDLLNLHTLLSAILSRR